MIGQINLESLFGRIIRRIAADSRYTTFCEVGTWNGHGSTKCFYEGLRLRYNTTLYSIEGNKEMYEQAKQVWDGVPQVKVMWGTLHRNVLSREEVEQHPAFDKISLHYKLHYDSEYKSCKESPLVHIPPCDVILLDGGEFSTKGDWEVLRHPNLKVVILDDTSLIKTSDIRRELLQDPAWTCVEDYPHDRNGWAIFQRSPTSS
jgi:hypothetical protein